MTLPGFALSLLQCPSWQACRLAKQRVCWSDRGTDGSQDLENTVGSWDMYGEQDSKRYPQIQSEFFERAAGPLTRREAIFSFLAAGQPGRKSLPVLRPYHP